MQITNYEDTAGHFHMRTTYGGHIEMCLAVGMQGPGGHVREIIIAACMLGRQMCKYYVTKG